MKTSAIHAANRRTLLLLTSTRWTSVDIFPLHSLLCRCHSIVSFEPHAVARSIWACTKFNRHVPSCPTSSRSLPNHVQERKVSLYTASLTHPLVRGPVSVPKAKSELHYLSLEGYLAETLWNRTHNGLASVDSDESNSWDLLPSVCCARKNTTSSSSEWTISECC